MKIHAPGADREGRDYRRRARAFTLPEITVSLALFTLLMIGIVTTNLGGLRWFNIVGTQIVATDSARKSINRLADDIRSSASVSVGNMSNSTFVGLAMGQAQTGNSLLVYTSTNSTNYILYFYYTNDQSFRRTVSALNQTSIVATSVTNNNIFQMQDCMGNVLSNSQNNFVIHCILQYYTTTPQSPVANSYTLETAATPRSMD